MSLFDETKSKLNTEYGKRVSKCMYSKMKSKDMSISNAINEPLDEKQSKLHLSYMYGKMLNEPSLDDETLEQVSEVYHDTDSHIINALDLRQGAPKGTDMYILYEQSVHGWQKLPDHLLALTVQEFQEVMDDGLTNGFEFCLQGSTLLFREVQS